MNIVSAFSGYSSDQITECTKFYRDILGLTLKEDMGGIGFDINGLSVFIYPKQDHEPATYTVLNFVVDDINTSIDELKTKGVTFERYDNLPAKQDERGVLRGLEAGMGPDIAWFRDPSANILALVQTS